MLPVLLLSLFSPITGFGRLGAMSDGHGARWRRLTHKSCWQGALMMAASKREFGMRTHEA